jgi:hypothetical protein
VFCGICGARMRSHASRATREATSHQRYVCDKRDRPPGVASHGIKRLASVIDKHVVRELLAELPQQLLEATRRAPEHWESLGRLLTARQTAEDRLRGLEDLLADGLLDRSGYVRQRRRLKAKLDEVEEQIAHVRAQAPRRRLRGATVGEIEAEWARLNLDEQRAVIGDYIDHVVIKPVGPGRKPDRDSVEIIWRQTP